MSYLTQRILQGRRLDIYALTAVLSPFFAAVTFFLFLFLMFQILRLSDFVIVHHAPLRDVFHMAEYLTLALTPFILPVAFLAAVLTGFGGLSAENELIAIKSCGVSLSRLLVPIFALSIVVSLGTLYLAFEGAPWAERSMNRTVSKIGQTQPANFLKEKVFNSGFFGLLVYLDEIDPITYELKSVFVLDEREPEFPVVITSHKGVILRVANKNKSSTQLMMKLFDGKQYSVKKGQGKGAQGPTELLTFEEYSIFLKSNEGADGEVLQTRMLTLKELVAEKNKTQAGSRDFKDYSMEIWKRLATSMAPLFFCFLGIGLGSSRPRTSHDRSWAILITFITMTFYWVTLTYATQNCTVGDWPAPWAVQLPNFGVGIVSIFALRRAFW